MDDIYDTESDPGARCSSSSGSKNGARVDVTIHSARPHSILEEYERVYVVDEDAYEQLTTSHKEL